MEAKFRFTATDLISKGRVDAANIQSIKEWLASENLPRLSDELISQFLISTCHDVQMATVTIKNYFRIRQSTPEMFSERHVEKMLQVGFYCVLPRRTADNCAIIVVKLRDGDARKFDFTEHLRLICMVLDLVVYEDPPDGLISILDLQGSSLRHLTSISLRLAATFAAYVQDAIPLKVRAVHLINGGAVLHTLFTMFAPFLKAQVREMVTSCRELETSYFFS
uniref:CRAL-TRIO domain-containing protein n=1 Tax=Photinus pyralis TaxID=7054 RepID=A0A1Y1KHP2_PHOPY